ncbi:MAG: hypothetical protein ACO1NO_14085 [Burkholderiaceae bacterium]
MNYMQCRSTGCGKPFQVNRFNTRFITSYEFGVIKCPHCGHAIKDNPESLFFTHALSREQEANFLAGALVAA